MITGKLMFRSFGVGKFKSKHIFLYTKGNPAIELPKKYIKKFFPSLASGCEYRETDVILNIVEIIKL